MDAIDKDETGEEMSFPASYELQQPSTDPRGADICLHTAKFRNAQRFGAGSMPSHTPAFVLSSAMLQEFLIWVVAFSALLGLLIVFVSRHRKKAQNRALADSVFSSGQEGGGHFDSDIIREYKERYYAREKGLEAAMRRSNFDEK